LLDVVAVGEQHLDDAAALRQACGADLKCVGLSINGDVDPRCRRASQDGDPCTRTCDGNFYCDG
jgi:hypothetical protein